MSDATRNVPVEPRTHSPECRRWKDTRSPHFALDVANCERCRNLWAAIEATAGPLVKGAAA
jgi:hypothetical protein